MNRFIFWRIKNLLDHKLYRINSPPPQKKKNIELNQLTKLESCDGLPSGALLLNQIQIIDYMYVYIFRLVNELSRIIWIMNQIRIKLFCLIHESNRISLLKNTWESWIESSHFMRNILSRKLNQFRFRRLHVCCSSMSSLPKPGFT